MADEQDARERLHALLAETRGAPTVLVNRFLVTKTDFGGARMVFGDVLGDGPAAGTNWRAAIYAPEATVIELRNLLNALFPETPPKLDG